MAFCSVAGAVCSVVLSVELGEQAINAKSAIAVTNKCFILNLLVVNLCLQKYIKIVKCNIFRWMKSIKNAGLFSDLHLFGI